MQLLAQDYAEVLAALEATKDTKGSERRTAARMEVQAKISVQPLVDGQLSKPYSCLTRDLSFKGIGLLQGRQSARGSQFVVRLPRPDAEPLSLICTVMFCRELADGLFNVGAAFNGPYEPDAPASPSPAASAVPGTSASKSELNRIRESILGF